MKLMPPTSFNRILRAQGWTHEQIAKKLDLTTRQIRRYVSGDAPIPHVVRLALHHLRAVA